MSLHGAGRAAASGPSRGERVGEKACLHTTRVLPIKAPQCRPACIFGHRDSTFLRTAPWLRDYTVGSIFSNFKRLTAPLHQNELLSVPTNLVNESGTVEFQDTVREIINDSVDSGKLQHDERNVTSQQPIEKHHTGRGLSAMSGGGQRIANRLVPKRCCLRTILQRP